MSNTDWNDSILSPFIPHNKKTSFDGAWESLYFEWQNADGFDSTNEQIAKTLFGVLKITDPILISHPICFLDHIEKVFGDLVKASNMGPDLPCFFDGCVRVIGIGYCSSGCMIYINDGKIEKIIIVYIICDAFWHHQMQKRTNDWR